MDIDSMFPRISGIISARENLRNCEKGNHDIGKVYGCDVIKTGVVTYCRVCGKMINLSKKGDTDVN